MGHNTSIKAQRFMQKSNDKRPGVIRLIGGKWRGRKISVPDLTGLRPTPDRVRETLFNWLSISIPNAYCLDAFAGTGALGFEALSRGAKQVVMIEQSDTAVVALRETATRFEATESVAIYQANVPEQLISPNTPFDIVFLDPPYHSHLLLPTCHYLEQHHFLAPIAYIYLEAEAVIKDNELPQQWRIIKAGHAGQVYYHLAKRE